MKFRSRMQNFGDELGRECAEAMSVPSEVWIAKRGGVSKLSKRCANQTSQIPKEDSKS